VEARNVGTTPAKTKATVIFDAIKYVRDAGDRLAFHITEENRMDALYPVVKSEAIARLMGTVDPQKGTNYSATAAEKLTDTDPVVKLHKEERRQATRATIVAATEFECARLAARAICSEQDITVMEALAIRLSVEHQIDAIPGDVTLSRN
jgi:hypothetical protein